MKKLPRLHRLARDGSTLALIMGPAVGPAVASAQVSEALPDTVALVADSSDLRSVARAAQDRFERRRHRLLPVSYGVGGGACDEIVGRFCTWYGEGEWYPEPEDERIVHLRAELVHELDTIQAHLPGDGWVLGQRVWYRSEGGDWEGALRTARRCGDIEPWWCRALEGFALHGDERTVEAERAFAQALRLMDPFEASEWHYPGRAIDSDARRLLENAMWASEDSASVLLERLWLLADPLYLIEGNDRLTEHYARRVVVLLREEARNPFRVSWGDDLDELVVRHGWEVGWERSPSRSSMSLDNVVGHKHPQGRDYMPPGAVLLDPWSASAESTSPRYHAPSSLYAPGPAPVLLPTEGQLAVFPRGAETVLVSTHYLPEDTTLHADHDHAVPWLEPGRQAGMPDRIGLFAVSADGRVRRTVREGRAEGALMLTVPTGPYFVSVETWSPPRRRAGRMRVGVPERPAPADVATLSDLLLVRPVEGEPASLEGLLDAALPRPRVRPGEAVAIAWEVSGLGFRAEALRFEVSVERSGVGVVRRMAEFLRFADRPRPLALSWEEPGPETPSPLLRYLSLDLPPLDEGEYVIRLVLHTVGRSDAVTTAVFDVRDEDAG